LNSFLLLGNVSYIRNNPLVLKENRKKCTTDLVPLGGHGNNPSSGSPSG
jgi:hypothetical protein